jgi:hypothetical protein
MEENAYFLLFKDDFGGSPLFKNQGDLASHIINTPGTLYYISKADSEYLKRLGNLKVYLSQLFSEVTRRNVTTEFKKSLQLVVKNRLQGLDVNGDEIVDTVIHDLVQKNSTNRQDVNKEPTNLYLEFYSNLANADYVSVFSTREIRLENKTSFTDLLLDGLIKALNEGVQNKWYRFNFPTIQTCALFWMALKNEIAKHFIINRLYLPLAIDQLYANKVISFNSKSAEDINKFVDIENKIASDILHFLSKSKIISVFHLSVPIYLIPFITFNPNDRNTRQTYGVFQSDAGEDRLHKLTKDELFYWSFFVWDNLRVNNYGTFIEYSDSYSGI